MFESNNLFFVHGVSLHGFVCMHIYIDRENVILVLFSDTYNIPSP